MSGVYLQPHSVFIPETSIQYPPSTDAKRKSMSINIFGEYEFGEAGYSENSLLKSDVISE